MRLALAVVLLDLVPGSQKCSNCVRRLQFPATLRMRLRELYCWVSRCDRARFVGKPAHRFGIWLVPTPQPWSHGASFAQGKKGAGKAKLTRSRGGLEHAAQARPKTPAPHKVRIEQVRRSFQVGEEGPNMPHKPKFAVQDQRGGGVTPYP